MHCKCQYKCRTGRFLWYTKGVSYNYRFSNSKPPFFRLVEAIGTRHCCQGLQRGGSFASMHGLLARFYARLCRRHILTSIICFLLCVPAQSFTFTSRIFLQPPHPQKSGLIPLQQSYFSLVGIFPRCSAGGNAPSQLRLAGIENSDMQGDDTPTYGAASRQSHVREQLSVMAGPSSNLTLFLRCVRPSADMANGQEFCDRQTVCSLSLR